MADVMVTGRMAAEKKAAGNRVLEQLGLNPSQAINLLYDRLIAEGDADFLGVARPAVTRERLTDAFSFITGMRLPATDMFDGMTKAEIALMRYRDREARREVAR